MKCYDYGSWMQPSNLIFIDGSANASDSTSENSDHEETRLGPIRESGELSHNIASSNNDKSGRNLRKRARSKSMKDETNPDLEARSHKQSKISPIPDTSPHEEAKRGKSKRKRKQKSADRYDSPKHYGKKSACKYSSPDDSTILPLILPKKQLKEERGSVESSGRSAGG